MQAAQDEKSQEESKVGCYVVGKTIGRGNFGKVRLARHIYTNQQVAIKILVKEKINDKNDLLRVSRELQILKKLRHPHIIQLYEIIETEKHLYIVTEYLSEGELFGLIVRMKRLPEETSLRFYNEILSGLEYMHALGVVHRDLKPENLLMDEKKRVKIADFGLSNTFNYPDETLKTACGSPCYASPEMIQNHRYCPMKSDLWSSGIILFAMLCGYLPFDVRTPIRSSLIEHFLTSGSVCNQDPDTGVLYEKILAGRFSIPSHISPFCQKLICGILQLDPQKRWSSEKIRSELEQHSKLGRLLKNIRGIDTGKFYVPPDPGTLSKIAHTQQNLNIKKLSEQIRLNRHNPATTHYYLLLKRSSLKNKPSRFDLNSDQFNFSTLEEKTTKFFQNLSESGFKKTADSSLNPLSMIKPVKATKNAFISFRNSEREASQAKMKFITMTANPKRHNSAENRISIGHTPVDIFGTMTQNQDLALPDDSLLKKMQKRSASAHQKQKSESNLRVQTEAFARKLMKESINSRSANKGLTSKKRSYNFLESPTLFSKSRKEDPKIFSTFGVGKGKADVSEAIYTSMRSSDKLSVNKPSKTLAKELLEMHSTLSTSKFKSKKPDFFSKSHVEGSETKKKDANFSLQSSIMKVAKTIRNKSEDTANKDKRGNTPVSGSIRKKSPSIQTRNPLRQSIDLRQGMNPLKWGPTVFFQENLKARKEMIGRVLTGVKEKSKDRGRVSIDKKKETQGPAANKQRNYSNPDALNSKIEMSIKKEICRLRENSKDREERKKRILNFSEKYSQVHAEKYNTAHRNLKRLGKGDKNPKN